jgi:hypothetical protein
MYSSIAVFTVCGMVQRPASFENGDVVAVRGVAHLLLLQCGGCILLRHEAGS